MKKEKIIYWASTGLVSLALLGGGISYLINPDMQALLTHLGFPTYFRIQLGVAEISGALVLGLPMFSDKLKELAYFGLAITFVSALIAHLAAGDTLVMLAPPLVLFGLLLVSYQYFVRVQLAHA